jgi:hypothetical protein
VDKFATVLYVDGSASKQSKRPVYRFRQEQSPHINRLRHADGVVAILDNEKMELLESLYWCVGGKQVGKAAVQFWRDTLVPL